MHRPSEGQRPVYSFSVVNIHMNKDELKLKQEVQNLAEAEGISFANALKLSINEIRLEISRRKDRSIKVQENGQDY